MDKSKEMVEVPFCTTMIDGENTSWLGIKSTINVSCEKFEYFESVSGTIELYGFGNRAIGYALWYSIRIVLDKENTQKANSLLKLDFNDKEQVLEAIYQKFGDGGDMKTAGLFSHLMHKYEVLKELFDEICEASGLTERANEQEIMYWFDDSYVEVDVDLPEIESSYSGEQQLLKVLSFLDLNDIEYKVRLCCIKNE